MVLFCFKISVIIISAPWIFAWQLHLLNILAQVSFQSDLPHPLSERASPFHSHPALYPLQVKKKFF